MSNQPPSNVPPQDDSNRYDQELASPPANQSREPVNPSALRHEAQERSQQRPILQKILSLFQKEKADFRELIINSEPLEKRDALDLAIARSTTSPNGFGTSPTTERTEGAGRSEVASSSTCG